MYNDLVETLSGLNPTSSFIPRLSGGGRGSLGTKLDYIIPLPLVSKSGWPLEESGGSWR